MSPLQFSPVLTFIIVLCTLVAFICLFTTTVYVGRYIHRRRRNNIAMSEPGHRMTTPTAATTTLASTSMPNATLLPIAVDSSITARAARGPSSPWLGNLCRRVSNVLRGWYDGRFSAPHLGSPGVAAPGRLAMELRAQNSSRSTAVPPPPVYSAHAGPHGSSYSLSSSISVIHISPSNAIAAFPETAM